MFAAEMLFLLLLFLTDSVKRTRLIIFVLLLVGLYGVSRSPLFSGKGSFSDTGLFPILFVPYICLSKIY